ncbi:MAG: hypothetical protein ABIH39_01920 [Candidatus Margulisiibacteriota bacterium]
MNTKIIKNNFGISIIEVVAAITIITMGMIGVLSLVIQNIQAQYINKNVLIAADLAGEGLELVRNTRDLNWLTGNDWNKDIVGNYTIDYKGSASINQSVDYIYDDDARLYVDSNGFYTHAVTAMPTNFYRLITVVDNIDYLDVKSTIRWKDGVKNHDYTAETYLYNWR